MGSLSLLNIVLLFYLLPIALLWRSRRRALGIVLVLLLSWLGFLIHRIAVARGRSR